jgi:SAM-dependent methyltransferase
MRATSDHQFRLDVAAAFSSIKAAFPFPRIISESSYFYIQAVLLELRRCIEDFSGKRLLDIGCGPMNKTAMLQSMGFQCWGADDLGDPWHCEPGVSEIISGFARDIGITFHRQSPNDYSIPFPEASFDVVCSFSVLEHLHESPREMLNTMGLFARTGGLIVVTMPNSVNLRKRLSVLAGKSNYPPIGQFYDSHGIWRGHVREYTLEEAVFICKRSGFDIVSASTFEHLAPTKLTAPWRQIYTSVGNAFQTTRSGLLVVCRWS